MAKLPRIVVAGAVSAMLCGFLVGVQPARADQPAAQRYIVTTTSGQVTAATVDKTEDVGGDVIHTYRKALHGFSAELTSAAADKLRRDPRVTAVVPDEPIHATGTQTSPPWGLDRIDQRSLPLSGSYTYPQTGAGVTAFVIDTGIRFSHSEFGSPSRATSGQNFVADGHADASDCAGHGTHVAGTIGGSTYGVAKGVKLVALRTLDCDGDGYTSSAIAALDWVLAHRPAGPAVVNMSLGGKANDLMDAAVNRTVAAGVPVVVAAGNSGDNACSYSPARATGAITVAASDSDDWRAWFSNYGSCVDLFAPGVDIESAWYTGDNDTNVLDGTSMASPHVAGLVARIEQSSPRLTPAQIKSKLILLASTGKIHDPMGSPNRLAFVSAYPERLPGSARSVVAKATNAKASGTITWTTPADPGNPEIIGYKVTRDGTNNQLRGAVTLTLPATARSATFAGLRGKRTYHLTVQAVNAAGAGSVVKANLVMGTVPLSAPTKVRVAAKSYAKRTAKITWAAPTDNGGHKIKGYRVYRNGKDAKGKGPYNKKVSAKARSFTFKNLKQNTTYSLQVRAKTSKGNGPLTTVTVKLTK